jgi:hypothetical protein
MKNWNYRVIKKNNHGQTTFQIHEVFYRPDGQIDSWASEPIEPLGTSEAQLRKDIYSFLAAFQLPALEERFSNGRCTLIEVRNSELSADHLEQDYQAKASRASGYIYQVLGNHLLIRNKPAVRKAYRKVDEALAELHDAARSA